jgi:hypothetical protein
MLSLPQLFLHTFSQLAQGGAERRNRRLRVSKIESSWRDLHQVSFESGLGTGQGGDRALGSVKSATIEP